ncbi:MAG TPA: transglycosylase SLT domain-containing protein [Burkholderiales bacterium]|jgi:soluble lytic murein transglycosylase-like protein
MNETGITRHLSCALAALRDLFALAGVAAIFVYFVLPLRGPIEQVLPTLPAALIDPLAVMASAAEGPTTVVETPQEREQRAVAEFIAKRYRVAEDAAAGFVDIAYRAGEQHRVDPLLILAVMAIESRYNPVAESVVGARGLMQVIPRYHPEKLEPHGGEQALLVPEVNIVVGAQILREYTRRFGDLEAALQMYNGALDEPTSRYANKVFAEKAQLDALRVKARKQQIAQAV